MNEQALIITYLIAAILFIRSLGGLSQQETARRGNLFGMIGMVLAIVATMFHERIADFGFGGAAIAAGAVVGIILAVRVQMTGMPQLVALLHSFVGLAAVLVGISTYLDHDPTDAAHATVHLLEIWVGVAVGAITFTGSIIAWAKLRGSMSGKPLLLPGRHLLNLVAVVVGVGYLAYLFLDASHTVEGMETKGLMYLYIMTGVTCLLGVHLVMAIGGADMPVVVSLLNSYSGWAAASAGFMLGNDLLIVTGALVGSSGAILSIIMCRAMNRSILNVVFGGFGTESGTAAAGSGEDQGEVVETSVSELVSELQAAKRVIIVPGYGMAVARAQHPVWEMTQILKDAGKKVEFAIHPVAGRLPGHMNVLLAEAGVPYDIVLEMEDINEDFPETDVVLVIGANDIVNPGAQTDTSSPIYGMPVLEAWKAARTVVFKRSMASGYAGVQNPLFFLDETRMLFGDAKKSVDAMVSELRGG